MPFITTPGLTTFSYDENFVEVLFSEGPIDFIVNMLFHFSLGMKPDRSLEVCAAVMYM